ncbi:MAG: hypothetical protein HY695_32890 [Deltaproteobacteria bacterium]|nr:hypothetical protein [Deltaproteobacteria bacterium]
MKRRNGNTLWIGLLAIAAFALIAADAWAANRHVRCGKRHKLSIVDLDMSPDPVEQGKRVHEWRVKVRVDGDGECETLLEIRERPGDDVAGRAVARVLRPGINNIEIEAAKGYRFRAREHCFQVLADIAQTRKPVDAARRFCARETRHGRRWTMRERGD